MILQPGEGEDGFEGDTDRISSYFDLGPNAGGVGGGRSSQAFTAARASFGERRSMSFTVHPAAALGGGGSGTGRRASLAYGGEKMILASQASPGSV